MSLLKTRRRKGVTALVAVLLIAIVSATAWAYFSGSGSDNEAFTTGTNPALVLTVGPISGQPVYPGESLEVDYTVTNNSGRDSGVGEIQLDPAHGDNGVGGLPAGCARAWFNFASVSVNQTLGNTATATSDVTPGWISGSLTFTETGTAQDACANANLTLGLKLVP